MHAGRLFRACRRNSSSVAASAGDIGELFIRQFARLAFLGMFGVNGLRRLSPCPVEQDRGGGHASGGRRILVLRNLGERLEGERRMAASDFLDLAQRFGPAARITGLAFLKAHLTNPVFRRAVRGSRASIRMKGVYAL